MVLVVGFVRHRLAVLLLLLLLVVPLLHHGHDVAATANAAAAAAHSLPDTATLVLVVVQSFSGAVALVRAPADAILCCRC